MNDDLRKKYLKTGDAVLKDGASSAAAAAAAALPVREAPQHNVAHAHGTIGGHSKRDSRKSGSASKDKSPFRWLWRLVKLASILLILFVALVVYFAIKGSDQSTQPTNSSKSTAAVPHAPSPTIIDQPAIAQKDQQHAAAEPPVVHDSAIEVPSTSAATARPTIADTAIKETHTQSASEIMASSPVPSTPRMPSATAWLSDFMIQHAGDTDCGALKDLYCKADLIRQAARQAYDDSVRCDRQQSSALQCDGIGKNFFERRYRELEIQTLIRQKNSLQHFLISVSRSGVSNGNVIALAEPCKRQAVNNGIRGAEYFDYVKHTCLPKALESYLLPKKEALQRVNMRLQELDTASTTTTYGPTERR